MSTSNNKNLHSTHARFFWFCKLLRNLFQTKSLNTGEEVFIIMTADLQFARLFTKLPRPGDSDVIFAVFESSFHLLLPVEPLKDRGNLVKYLGQGHNKRTCRPVFTLSLLMLNVKQGAVNINF